MISKYVAFALLLLAGFVFTSPAGAEDFPGSCIQWFYINDGEVTVSTPASGRVGSLSFSTATANLPVSVASTVSSTHWTKVYVLGAYWDKDWGHWSMGQQYGVFTLTDMSSLEAVGAVQVPNFSLTTLDSAVNGCPVPTCSSKTGEIGYDLHVYPPGQQQIPEFSCYEGCKQSTSVTWELCTNESCAASVQYTYTGEACSEGDSIIDDIESAPPKKCDAELQALIAQCGGSLKVQSFDFETCSGVCTPDSCGGKWDELIDRCGGLMAVSTWDESTCSGTCVSDPVPDIQKPDSEAVPDDIKTETKTNPDGTSEVTRSITYNVDGNTYTQTTITTYDSSGNTTGTSTSISSSPSSGKGEGDTFPGIPSPSEFVEPYNPGEYDIPARFTTFLNNVKSSGLFSFSSDFFDSLPGGGSPLLTIDGGATFGSHTYDFSQAFHGGLTILKSVLLALFGFLSIRAVIMKR